MMAWCNVAVNVTVLFLTALTSTRNRLSYGFITLHIKRDCQLGSITDVLTSLKFSEMAKFIKNSLQIKSNFD